MWILGFFGISTYLITPAFIQARINSSFYEIEKLWPDGNKRDSENSANSSNMNLSYRIQFLKWGNCIGSSSQNNSNLEVTFCDPNEKQTFIRRGGSLVFKKTGSCVEIENAGTLDSTFQLKLGDCTGEIAKFTLVNETYLQLNMVGVRQDTPVCLSPVIISNTTEAANYQLQLGTLVGFAPCHENASQITFIEENDFRKRRKALLLPQPPNPDTSCDFPACAINTKTEPVKLLLPEHIDRCSKMSDCVTLVTKTARRPELVLRMVQSLQSVKGYDLPTIVYDDGGDPYPETDEVMRGLSNFTNLKYIVGDTEDVGIALGRSLAIQHVKTKYFLLLDDDSVINRETNIELLAEILDSTDASLVGGKATGYRHFAGFLQFAEGIEKDVGKRKLYLYRSDSKNPIDETVVNNPSCEQCDVTSNIFMAKTKDILEVGGWSKELKIVEHKDLFLRLKAAKKKVVYCPGFQVFNRKETVEAKKESGYESLRTTRRFRMNKVFNNVWNIHLFKERSLGSFSDYQDKMANHVAT